MSKTIKSKAKTTPVSKSEKQVKAIDHSKDIEKCETAISFLLDEVESMNVKINKLMSRIGLE